MDVTCPACKEVPLLAVEVGLDGIAVTPETIAAVWIRPCGHPVCALCHEAVMACADPVCPVCGLPCQGPSAAAPVLALPPSPPSFLECPEVANLVKDGRALRRAHKELDFMQARYKALQALRSLYADVLCAFVAEVEEASPIATPNKASLLVQARLYWENCDKGAQNGQDACAVRVSFVRAVLAAVNATPPAPATDEADPDLDNRELIEFIPWVTQPCVQIEGPFGEVITPQPAPLTAGAAAVPQPYMQLGQGGMLLTAPLPPRVVLRGDAVTAGVNDRRTAELVVNAYDPLGARVPAVVKVTSVEKAERSSRPDPTAFRGALGFAGPVGAQGPVGFAGPVGARGEPWRAAADPRVDTEGSTVRLQNCTGPVVLTVRWCHSTRVEVRIKYVESARGPVVEGSHHARTAARAGGSIRQLRGIQYPVLDRFVAPTVRPTARDLELQHCGGLPPLPPGFTAPNWTHHTRLHHTHSANAELIEDLEWQTFAHEMLDAPPPVAQPPVAQPPVAQPPVVAQPSWSAYCAVL